MSAHYEGYTEIFFQHLAKQEIELAVNTLFQTNPWMSRMIDQVANICSQLSGLNSMAGNYIDYQVLVDKVFNNVYAAQSCLALYDRQPIKFEFQYYKPRDEWRIQNFNMSVDFPEDVSNIVQYNLPHIFK